MLQDRDEFTEALEMELRLRGFAFQRWALLDFVAGSRHLIEEDPSPGRWARAFIEAQGDPACAAAR